MRSQNDDDEDLEEDEEEEVNSSPFNNRHNQVSDPQDSF